MPSITFFTAEKVAEIFGFHRSQIYRALDRKVIFPHGCVGRVNCFDPDQLPTILDRLTPFVTVSEYTRAKERLIEAGYWKEPNQRPAPRVVR